MIPTELIKFCRIQENGFGAEVEITTKITRLRVPIAEVSISYVPRTFSEGKKINARDGVYALYLVLKYWSKDLHFNILGTFLRSLRECFTFSSLSLNVSSVVVEIECGRQALLGWQLRTRVKKYIGFDTEVEDMVFDRIELRRKTIDDMRALGIKEKVDAIVAQAVTEHLNYSEKVIKLSHGILKKGGKILITTPHPKTDGLLKLQALLTKYGFRIVRAERFLFSMIVGEKV